MKHYFLTVNSLSNARVMDPNAEIVRVLPKAKVVHCYCCKPSEVVGYLPERYVVFISTNLSRREIRQYPGVIRVRRKMLDRYNDESGMIVHEVC
jgi:hypothetical protein